MKRIVILTLAGLAFAVPTIDETQAGVEIVYGEDASDYPEETSGYFEGDIELQPGENPLHRNAVADRRKRWPGGVVPYEISSSYPTVVKNIFMKAMQEIEIRTKVNGKTCIHFQPHHGETGFVKFVTGNGCHSPIGYINRQASITIGHGCERQGTVMHELLHALGFWNEQNRPDRDNYVIIHPNNIQTGHEGAFFNKFPAGYMDLLGQPYDYGSIMHCSAYAFAIDRSKMTIEPKQRGVTIGQRVRLSDTDVKKIQLLYDCIPPSGHTSAPSGFITAAAATTAKPPAGSDVCTFETNFCNWTQSHSDQTDWRRHAGATPSAHTGPSTDAHGSKTGHYIYVEASGHINQSAKLDSQAYPDGGYCMDFYYNMYGADISYLRLNVVASSHSIHMNTWSGNHSSIWIHQRMNAHIHFSGTFKFELEAHTGSGFHSDIAIDDIIIHAGNC